MNKLKRMIVVGAAAGILFCGCQAAIDTETPVPYDDSKDKLLADAETKVAYYEGLAVNLQDRLLEVQSALYTSRAEYDALYALYQASNKEPSNEASGSSTSTAVDSFRYIKENGGVTVTAYLGKSKEVVLPTHIDGLPVLAVFDRAFSQNTDITSITLPEGVESIGWFAFSGCTSLQTVTLPASVQTISYGAFDNCNKDLTVVCPEKSYARQYAQSYGLKAK
ncbi:MAG: leucine-rich repeat domain-containing protein [Clostridia bacterium]|nr:leucine-rich repeat domain-containing protein [Clostridia bacterium]